MRSVLFLTVILMASAAQAASLTLSGGPGEMSRAKLLGLGVLEEVKSCSDSRKSLEEELRKTAGIYLVPAAFPVPKKANPAEASGCDVVVEIANGTIDALSATINRITHPDRNEIACVAAAQKSFSARATNYRSCPANATKLGAESPCRTEDAVSTMARSMNVVSECLGIDRKDLFRIASEATGMVPDAFSPRVESAMRTVRDTVLGLTGVNAEREADVKINKAIGDNVLCASLSQMSYNFVAGEEKTACERMTQPGGTFLPLYYQAKAFLFLRTKIDAVRGDLEAASGNKLMRSKFGTEADYQSVLRAVALSGSIAGEVNARKVFFTLLKRPFKDAKDFLTRYQAEIVVAVPDDVRPAMMALPAELEEVARTVNSAAGGGECYSQ